MLMTMGGAGAVLVCDDRGRVLGVVSERDLMLALAETGDQFFQLCVGEVMTVDVPAATPNTAVQSVMRIMTEQGAGHMPVIENGVAVGMVSMGDVLKPRLAKRFGSTPSRRIWRDADSRPERKRACPPRVEASRSWDSPAPIAAGA